MAAVRWNRRRVRRARPEDEPGQVDRHPCRPDLRFALATACPRGSLCVHGLQGEICERFRGRVDQGDGPRSLRRRLTSAETRAVKTRFCGLDRTITTCQPRSFFSGAGCFLTSQMAWPAVVDDIGIFQQLSSGNEANKYNRDRITSGVNWKSRDYV